MTTARREPPLSELFFALADDTRLEVVARLARRARRASELAEEIGASRPAMSRHLRILRGARVIRDRDDETDGRARLIALDAAALDRVRGLLDELEGFWTEQLASFKALAEARAVERARPRGRSKQAP